MPANPIPLLDVQNLHISYGALDVLRGVNLVLCPGDVVFVRGGNASGKSTLLRSILGLIRPKKGRILFNGEDVTRLSPDERVRRGMAFLPENRRLFPDLTIEENLCICKWAISEVDRFEERLSVVYSDFPLLWERRRTLAKHLSGGQQQIVALARMAILAKQLWLLDEPTAGLDSKARNETYTRLFSKFLNRTNTWSMIIIEQYYEMPMEISSRVYLIVDKRLDIILQKEAS